LPRLQQAATRATSPLAARDLPIGRAAQSVESYLALMDIKTAGPPPETTRIALGAFDRCGKGLRPAQLNFGDRFAYTAARDLGEPLMFKGADVSLTDIEAARGRPVRCAHRKTSVRGQSPILAGEPAAVG
jgi:ribonuclease VapC